MCPVPRPSADRRLLPGRLLRAVCVRPCARSLFTDAKAKKSLDRRKGRRRGELQVGLYRRRGRQRLAAAAQGGRWSPSSRLSPRGRNTSPRRRRTCAACPSTAGGGSSPNLLRDSDEFRRNLANRLWAQMFGRGHRPSGRFSPCGQSAEPSGAVDAAGRRAGQGQVRRQGAAAADRADARVSAVVRCAAAGVDELCRLPPN